jgi:superfamily II DNA/RNA helicase
MSSEIFTRDQLANLYFEQLPFEPYPVQEEALLAWFTSEQGVLVSAPTGMGKTLIAEAALFEALHTRKRAYYTTPLIALTEQKLQEVRAAAVRWGFQPDDVGLLTGNRRLNPDAPILVVVAEILFNRLLHPDAFDFSDVTAVVMDEFHSFNDPERGVVWELSLGLLPKHIRLLLLSATVGNSLEFSNWLNRCHHHHVELVQSEERRVPLSFEWVGDMLLNEKLEEMTSDDETLRRTPALVFCFNREECWNIAEQLKGKKLLADGQQARLVEELKDHDWSEGAGPKLRQMLMRGVGVHHAGLLPKYKRIVESLFQRKLLSFTICTETLAAGINLPARSVVVPNLLKGPRDRKKLIAPSAAQQMFGRAGRPQFDSEGFIYALAHEDDVRILRWREKYDQIPDDTKDQGLRKAKKALKKKMPKRRSNVQYWTAAQFEQLRTAPASKLESKGALPWRLLAYMLDASPEVETIRQLVGKRLMTDKKLEAGQRELDRMLMILWKAGYVTLEPDPPEEAPSTETQTTSISIPSPAQVALVGEKLSEAEEPYRPQLARPTPELKKLLLLRSVHPLYGMFLVNQLGIADRSERIQAFESVLEMPLSLGKAIRVPPQEVLPPGPLAVTRLDTLLLQAGLATPGELSAAEQEEQEEQEDGYQMFQEERVWVLALAEKLRRLFEHKTPGVHDFRINSVWVAGGLLEHAGNFSQYVNINRLQKQEGVVFRHLLRLILLIGEFLQFCPPDTEEEDWQGDLNEIRERLVESCRHVDSTSTDKVLEEEQAAAKLGD